MDVLVETLHAAQAECRSISTCGSKDATSAEALRHCAATLCALQAAASSSYLFSSSCVSSSSDHETAPEMHSRRTAAASSSSDHPRVMTSNKSSVAAVTRLAAALCDALQHRSPNKTSTTEAAPTSGQASSGREDKATADNDDQVEGGDDDDVKTLSLLETLRQKERAMKHRAAQCGFVLGRPGVVSDVPTTRRCPYPTPSSAAAAPSDLTDANASRGKKPWNSSSVADGLSRSDPTSSSSSSSPKLPMIMEEGMSLTLAAFAAALSGSFESGSDFSPVTAALRAIPTQSTSRSHINDMEHHGQDTHSISQFLSPDRDPMCCPDSSRRSMAGDGEGLCLFAGAPAGGVHTLNQAESTLDDNSRERSQSLFDALVSQLLRMTASSSSSVRRLPIHDSKGSPRTSNSVFVSTLSAWSALASMLLSPPSEEVPTTNPDRCGAPTSASSGTGASLRHRTSHHRAARVFSRSAVRECLDSVLAYLQQSLLLATRASKTSAENSSAKSNSRSKNSGQQDQPVSANRMVMSVSRSCPWSVLPATVNALHPGHEGSESGGRPDAPSSSTLFPRVTNDALSELRDVDLGPTPDRRRKGAAKLMSTSFKKTSQAVFDRPSAGPSQPSTSSPDRASATETQDRPSVIIIDDSSPEATKKSSKKKAGKSSKSKASKSKKSEGKKEAADRKAAPAAGKKKCKAKSAAASQRELSADSESQHLTNDNVIDTTETKSSKEKEQEFSPSVSQAPLPVHSSILKRLTLECGRWATLSTVIVPLLERLSSSRVTAAHAAAWGGWSAVFSLASSVLTTEDLRVDLQHSDSTMGNADGNTRSSLHGNIRNDVNVPTVLIPSLSNTGTDAGPPALFAITGCAKLTALAILHRGGSGLRSCGQDAERDIQLPETFSVVLAETAVGSKRSGGAAKTTRQDTAPTHHDRTAEGESGSLSVLIESVKSRLSEIDGRRFLADLGLKSRNDQRENSNPFDTRDRTDETALGSSPSAQPTSGQPTSRALECTAFDALADVVGAILLEVSTSNITSKSDASWSSSKTGSTPVGRHGNTNNVRAVESNTSIPTLKVSDHRHKGQIDEDGSVKREAVEEGGPTPQSSPQGLELLAMGGGLTLDLTPKSLFSPPVRRPPKTEVASPPANQNQKEQTSSTQFAKAQTGTSHDHQEEESASSEVRVLLAWLLDGIANDSENLVSLLAGVDDDDGSHRRAERRKACSSPSDSSVATFCAASLVQRHSSRAAHKSAPATPHRAAPTTAFAIARTFPAAVSLVTRAARTAVHAVDAAAESSSYRSLETNGRSADTNINEFSDSNDVHGSRVSSRGGGDHVSNKTRARTAELRAFSCTASAVIAAVIASENGDGEHIRHRYSHHTLSRHGPAIINAVERLTALQVATGRVELWDQSFDLRLGAGRTDQGREGWSAKSAPCQPSSDSSVLLRWLQGYLPHVRSAGPRFELCRLFNTLMLRSAAAAGSSVASSTLVVPSGCHHENGVGPSSLFDQQQGQRMGTQGSTHHGRAVSVEGEASQQVFAGNPHPPTPPLLSQNGAQNGGGIQSREEHNDEDGLLLRSNVLPVTGAGKKKETKRKAGGRRGASSSSTLAPLPLTTADPSTLIVDDRDTLFVSALPPGHEEPTLALTKGRRGGRGARGGRGGRRGQRAAAVLAADEGVIGGEGGAGRNDRSTPVTITFLSEQQSADEKAMREASTASLLPAAVTSAAPPRSRLAQSSTDERGLLMLGSVSHSGNREGLLEPSETTHGAVTEASHGEASADHGEAIRSSFAQNWSRLGPGESRGTSSEPVPAAEYLHVEHDASSARRPTDGGQAADSQAVLPDEAEEYHELGQRRLVDSSSSDDEGNDETQDTRGRFHSHDHEVQEVPQPAQMLGHHSLDPSAAQHQVSLPQDDDATADDDDSDEDEPLPQRPLGSLLLIPLSNKNATQASQAVSASKVSSSSKKNDQREDIDAQLPAVDEAGGKLLLHDDDERADEEHFPRPSNRRPPITNAADSTSGEPPRVESESSAQVPMLQRSTGSSLDRGFGLHSGGGPGTEAPTPIPSEGAMPAAPSLNRHGFGHSGLTPPALPQPSSGSTNAQCDHHTRAAQGLLPGTKGVGATIEKGGDKAGHCGGGSGDCVGWALQPPGLSQQQRDDQQEALLARIIRLANALTASNTALREAQHSNMVLTEQCRLKDDEVHRKDALVSEQAQRLNEQSSQIAQQMETIGSIQSENVTLQETLSRRERELSNTTERLRESDSRNQKLDETFQEQAVELQTAKATIGEETTARQAAEKSVQEHLHEISSLREASSVLQERIDEHTSDLHDTKCELAEVSEELADAKREGQATAAELQETCAALRDAETTNDELSSALKSARSELKTVSESFALTSNELEATKQTMSNQSAEIQSLSAERAQDKATIATLSVEIAAAKNEVSSLTGDLCTAKSEVKRLESELQTKETATLKLTANIAAVEEERDEERCRADKAEGKVGRLKGRLDQVQSVLGQMSQGE